MSDLSETHSLPAPEAPLAAGSSRLSVPEIAQRLGLGRQAVYQMLEQGILPGLRLGRRWIITRHAFETWEKTCGTKTPSTESVALGDFTSVPERGRSLLCQ